MRNPVIVAAVLAAGGATAVGVSACGSSGDKDKAKSPPAATTTATTTAATPAKPPPPPTLTVRVGGKATMVEVADISFSYCRSNARTCAAIKSAQQSQLTPNQRKAIKAAVAQVRAQDAAAQEPAPQLEPAPEPAPVPEPAPAPEPQPQSGGETTTG